MTTKKKSKKQPAATTTLDDVKKQMAQLEAEGYTAISPALLPPRGSQPQSHWDSILNNMLGTPASMVMNGGSRATGMFTSVGQEQPCAEVGIPELGYIAWGDKNNLPNTIALLASMLPYTAAGVEFNTNVCAGLGPVPKYRYSYFVNGQVSTEEIDYSAAGELIEGKLLEAQSKLLAHLNTPPTEAKATDAHATITDSLLHRIGTLQADLEKWRTTYEELTGFLERNNLDIITSQLFSDMVHYDICFPELQLSQDATQRDNTQWQPKVVGIDCRNALTCRLERKDNQGIINNVYISNQWLLGSVQLNTEDTKIAAIPALDTKHPLQKLRRTIKNYRLTNGRGRTRRPTRYVMPVYKPTSSRPYYPQPAWWSVFGGEIYSYASTIISDRATRKRNSNSFGRIIYIHQDYLSRLFQQSNCKTNEEKNAVRDTLLGDINTFLANSDNNGQPLVSFTFTNPSNNQQYDAYRIVDVPYNNKQKIEANKTELEEVAGIIFFAMGIHPDLIGAVPGRSGSSGGTYQREMYEMKKMLMASTQNSVLKVMEVASQFNQWDTHLVWRVKQMTLTTLDRNKNGMEETAV